MTRTPAHARYNWWPISLTTLGVASFIYLGGVVLAGGNEHDTSHSPGLDTMPSFAVETPVAAPQESSSLPARARGAAAWVCKGFVFIDRDKHDVIVDPVVDNEAQRPLDLVDVDAGGANFAQPQPRANFELWRFVGGRLIRDGDGRLNRCIGDDPIAPVEVHNSKGESRYVLADASTKVHDGQEVGDDAATAVERGLVHVEYTMDETQIDAFIDKLD